MLKKTKLHFSTTTSEQIQAFPIVLNPEYVEKILVTENNILPENIVDNISFKQILEEKKQIVLEYLPEFLESIEEIFEEYFEENKWLSLDFKENFLGNLKAIINNDKDFIINRNLTERKYYNNNEEIDNYFGLFKEMVYLIYEKNGINYARNIFRRNYLFNTTEKGIKEFLELDNKNNLISFIFNIVIQEFFDYTTKGYNNYINNGEINEPRYELDDFIKGNIHPYFEEQVDSFYIHLPEANKPIVNSNDLDSFIQKNKIPNPNNNPDIIETNRLFESIIKKNIIPTISIETYKEDLILFGEIINNKDINSLDITLLDSLNNFIKNNTKLFEEYLLKNIKNKPTEQLIENIDGKMKISEPLLRFYSNYIIKNNYTEFNLFSGIFNELQIYLDNYHLSVSEGNIANKIYNGIYESYKIKDEYIELKGDNSFNYDNIGLYNSAFYQKVFNNIKELEQLVFYEIYGEILEKYPDSLEILFFEYIGKNRENINSEDINFSNFKNETGFDENIFLNKDYFFDYKITKEILEKIFHKFKIPKINNKLELFNNLLKQKK